MTLCIAWKDKDIIHMASDSRLTFSRNPDRYVDICPKVVSIPLIAKGPEPNKDDNQIRYNLGMCFTGSFINIYSLKEEISRILQSIQYVPGISVVSMDIVCDIIQKFFTKISQDLRNILFKNGNASFIFAGFCPEAKTTKTFIFHLNNSHSTQSEFNEILVSNNYEIIGDGKDKAEQLIQEEYNSKFKAIKAIIEDNNYPTVGGNIQYGRFVNENFQIFGVENYRLDIEEKIIKIYYDINGLELIDDQLSTESITVKNSFIKPFEMEIKSLIDDGYRVE